MHLVETYALATGSKIGKPFIHKKFFPLPFDKYITVQNSSGMTGKCYDYFQQVLDLIYADLDAAGYKVVQIGEKDDRPIRGAHQTQGQTDINQTAHILDNSKLHLGNDSFAVHMCSAFDVPVVAMYSVASPDVAGPYWKSGKQICITPENWRASYNPNEAPKRVNEIKVEQVIAAVGKLLDLKLNTLETISVGEQFLQTLIECEPDQVLSPESFATSMLNVRFDYVNLVKEIHYKGLAQNLANRKCAIVTDKPLAVEYFAQYKKNLPMVIYDITKGVNIDFLNKLNNFGIPTRCVFKNYESTDETLRERKEQLIELPQIIETVELNKLDPKLLETKGLRYFSAKFFVANNKVYHGKSGYLANDPVEGNVFSAEGKTMEGVDLDVFLKEDAAHAFLFTKKA
jgi:hypothetical protein